MRWRAAAWMAAGLAAGGYLFVAVRGPVRGWFGDVLVVVVLVAALVVVGVPRASWRLGAVALLALGTEAFQATGLVPRDAHWFVHLTLGSTFDVLDFAAYAVGLLAAAGLEQTEWAPWRRGMVGGRSTLP